MEIRFRHILFVVTILLCGTKAVGQEISDSLRIHFQQSKSLFNESVAGNSQFYGSLADLLEMAKRKDVEIVSITVYGAASPEGGIGYNKGLSKRRADRVHNYWRTYGGDVELRKWLGSAARRKPLTGHHIVAYAQIVTYDFELGGRGYLADRWSYAAGVSYGYSLPVAKRLNIDFSMGLGYMGGEYKEYLPQDGHYVWQSTKRRHWIGPTKAEISLVWLIGRGNTNRTR